MSSPTQMKEPYPFDDMSDSSDTPSYNDEDDDSYTIDLKNIVTTKRESKPPTDWLPENFEDIMMVDIPDSEIDAALYDSEITSICSDDADDHESDDWVPDEHEWVPDEDIDTDGE